MARLKLGYVGCGFMAQKVHLPNFLSIPECEVSALAEVRPELGRKVQARLRVPTLYCYGCCGQRPADASSFAHPALSTAPVFLNP